MCVDSIQSWQCNQKKQIEICQHLKTVGTNLHSEGGPVDKQQLTKRKLKAWVSKLRRFQQNETTLK